VQNPPYPSRMCLPPCVCRQSRPLTSDTPVLSTCVTVRKSKYIPINQPLYVFPRLLEHPSSSSRSTVVLSLLLWLRRTRSSRILCLPISYLRAFAIAYSSVLPGMHHINVVVVCFLLSPMRTRNCCQYICPLLEFLSRSLWLGTSLSNIFWH